MKLTTDVLLKGDVWTTTLDKMVGKIFPYQYDIYVLSISIGISNDRIVETLVQSEETPTRSIPRTMLYKNADVLSYLFETAILCTSCVDISEKERLEIAFNDENDMKFNKIDLLTKFANAGIEEIGKCISEVDEETITNISKLCQDLLTDDIQRIIKKLDKPLEEDTDNIDII